VAAESDADTAIASFLAGSAPLAEALGNASTHYISARRAERYAERESTAFALVAVHLDRPSAAARNAAALLCHAALIRKHLMGFDRWAETRQLDDETQTAVVDLAVGSVELRQVRLLAGAVADGWTLQACRAPLAGITPIDIPARGDSLLARASYGVAKRLISAGDRHGALAALKRTTLDPSVYVDAVALMVPLLAVEAPEIAARLEKERLDLNQVQDPDALDFLGQAWLAVGRVVDADKAFAACLAREQANPGCRTGREETAKQINRPEPPFPYDEMVERRR
jgi:hypothetical protein